MNFYLSKKIKICILSLPAYSLFNPKCRENFGGAEMQSYLLAKELAKDRTYLVNFIVDDCKQKDIEIKNKIIIYKFKKPKFFIGFISKIISSIYLFKLLKKINADIYYQNAFGPQTIVISLFCKIYQKKFIYLTASEIEVIKPKNPNLDIKLAIIGLKKADLVLTQNNSHKKLLKKNFQINSLVFKNILKIPAIANFKNKKNILWVASSQPLKQPDIFLEIAKSFPDEKFEMVMPKHSSNENLWREIRRRAKNIPNLKVYNTIPFKKINLFFKRAKIFINTSTVEGFPNTFVQAAAYSTPVFSLNINPDNFINQYKCGFYAHNNLDLMKKQISRLLKNKKLFQQTAKNAYQYANENHNIEKNILQYKKYLQILIKKGLKPKF